MPIKWNARFTRRGMISGVVILAWTSFLTGTNFTEFDRGDRGPSMFIIVGLFSLALLLGLIVEIRKQYPG
jgi:hypothetical protein